MTSVVVILMGIAISLIAVFGWLIYHALKIRANIEVSRGQHRPPDSQLSSQMKAEIFVETYISRKKKVNRE